MQPRRGPVLLDRTGGTGASTGTLRGRQAGEAAAVQIPAASEKCHRLGLETASGS